MIYIFVQLQEKKKGYQEKNLNCYLYSKRREVRNKVFSGEISEYLTTVWDVAGDSFSLKVCMFSRVIFHVSVDYDIYNSASSQVTYAITSGQPALSMIQ